MHSAVPPYGLPCALSEVHVTGLEEWRKVIFSDKVSIIVSTKRSMQNISRIVRDSERYHPDCIKQRRNNYVKAMF